jgi:hypothetical protein
MNIKAAFPILLLLIAANFVAFVVNVWYLLPTPNDVSAVNNVRLRPPISKAVGSSTRAFKKRIRQAAPPDKTIRKEPIRYDKISSILQSSYGIVHQLPSIPPQRRMIPGTYGEYIIPPDATTNLTYFLQSRIRNDEEERPLYLYNPSLLPLNGERIDESIIKSVNDGVEELSYIATFRVSNFGNCHGPGRGVPDTYRNYLGIALLDDDLNILQNKDGEYYDAVIDLNAQLMGGKKQNLQDCQIYYHDDGVLLLQCNEYVMEVDLSIRGSDAKPPSLDNNRIALNNHYGTKLQLTILHKPHMILRGGKNMHHFGPGYMEIWPSGPHEYIPINLSTYPFVSSSLVKSPGMEPEPSYPTPEGKALIDRDSGSACCVSIPWNDGKEQLLLGFSHRKTRKAPKKDSYNYVSRVYAFEPKPPFNIVARSGFFCLGFANVNTQDHAEAIQSNNEQIFGSANDYKLTISKQEYDCPRIHFVTGITEKIDDKSTVIVSYGVNDCYPRMVEIKKEFLTGLLKGEGLD